ncbi:thermosome subunit alpha [Nitzschia inconspicua]|uniref:Thermosome subunit alpha n=1 Tax=Nitzschia inconspicua TaxID=303405 RepID=A0A9K3KFN4_9STRA|nr:thermosome subunit alpha [Nitzschia inconspicua]
MSSMAYNAAAGLGGMLKAGHEHYFDDDADGGAVVARSISAACELSRMLSSSLGPQGRNKLVVNHLEKIIVTSDCASILKEIEVEHPAAKLLELAVEQQEKECGDGTNLSLMFAGELLSSTLDLMKTMGWRHKTDILEGYHLAATKLLKDLLSTNEDEKGCVVGKLQHPASSPEALKELQEKVLKPVLGSKQYGTEDILSDLVGQACQIVLQEGMVLQPESIRTVKILGGNLSQSACVQGFVAQRGVETTKTHCEKAKIAVYASGVEASATEAKGTVLMKTADDLKNYNRTEEAKMEEIIQGIAESGVQVLVTGGNISDMALHFIEKYGLVALKLSSKWELRRLCQATGATALVRLGAPTPEEMGYSTVTQKVVGGRTVTVFENDVDGSSKIATLVLRASTSSVLNDLERAVEDGVHAVQMACKDGRLVYGGGACEMECAVQLDQFADQHPGLEQYAIRAFAKSLECVARTLADNAGWDAVQVLADIRAAHVNGQADVGVDITNAPGSKGMKEANVYDLMYVKRSALKLAIEAATTVLKVDQIIMSKRSGGPKMPGQ